MPSHPQATICRICSQICGLLVSDDGDRITIRGNPDHPVTQGFACFRGINFDQVVNSPERLMRPLLKKNGVWREIEYQDGIDIIAEKLMHCKNLSGAESVGVLKGESLKHQEIPKYLRHFLFGFGSPNYMSVGSVCHRALDLGYGLTLGGMPKADFEKVGVIVLWGVNPAISLVHLWSKIIKAKKRGVKLIVIDPLSTASAKAADLHLPISPASDGFLALALIKHALEKEMLAPGGSSTTGWEDLKQLAASQSINDLIAKTGLSDALFQEAIDLIFGNLPGWVKVGGGLELLPTGVQAIRSVAMLQSLIDSSNMPKRLSASLNGLPMEGNYPDMPAPISDRSIPVFTKAYKEAQFMHLPRAVLDNDPYPIKALMVAGSNPLMTFPQTGRFRKAFENLEFLAVFDLFMTPTARMADLILPASTHLETLELHDYGQNGPPFLALSRPVVNSGKGWPLWKVIFELAARVGLKDYFPWSENHEAIRHRMAGCGVPFDDLDASPSATMRYLPDKSARASWQAPSGEIHYRSKLLEREKISGLPGPADFKLPFEPDEDYPFWLGTGNRIAYFQHSQYRNVSRYRENYSEPHLDMHPSEALMLDIEDGERVRVSTRHGQIQLKVRLTEDVQMGCLAMAHGWEEANANEITSGEYLDPISGFPWARCIPANVEKCA